MGCAAPIGLLTDLMGTEAIHEEVNGAVHNAVQLMEHLGATVLHIAMPHLTILTTDVAMGSFEFREAFNRYLARVGPDAPVKNLAEFLADGSVIPASKAAWSCMRLEDGTQSVEQKPVVETRSPAPGGHDGHRAQRPRCALYPHQKRLVAGIGEEQLERNGVLSNGTGFPAITFPGGFSRPTRSAPLGVPIGIELLGPEWSEPHLIRLAYAFEQAAQLRRPPASTPA